VQRGLLRPKLTTEIAIPHFAFRFSIFQFLFSSFDVLISNLAFRISSFHFPVSIFQFRFSNFEFRFSNFQFLFSSFYFPISCQPGGPARWRKGAARRRLHQIWRGNQFIDQAQGQGLAGRKAFCGQQELRRRRPAEQASQALSSSPARDEAKRSPGMAKASIVGRDASVARQSQIQAPSQTIASDGRNHGKREVRNVVQECLSRQRKIACPYPLNRCDLLEGGAGGERAEICGNHDALEKVGESHLIQEAAQFPKDSQRKPRVSSARRKGQHCNRIVAG
jgi:hypothetical protein